MIETILKFGSSVIGFAKGSPYKLIIILTLILSIITAITGFYQFQLHQAYERGRAETLVEFQSAAAASRARQAKKAKEKLDEVVSNRDKWKDTAINLQKKLNKKPKVKVVTIVKTVEDMACKSLGSDGYELWVNITSKPIGVK